MGGLSRNARLALVGVVAFTALSGVGRYAGWTPVLAFALATAALAGLAWVVSFATEQVGERLGPAATGLLQSTVGNLPELFVVLFAIDKGETVVAQTSILGSIFANAMLVLGLVIVVGARRSRDGIMRFSRQLPRDTATLLLLTVFIIAVVALSLSSHDKASHHVQGVSVVAAVNVAGVVLAHKGKSDLAISVVKNSVSQIAAFLFPLLVLISLPFATPLTFAISPVYVGALALMAIAVWQITGDGEAAAFEGFALIALYVVLAALTLYE